jgi:DNA-binding SARP family transcriptional activator
VEFRILGPLEVVDDGHDVAPRQPKRRAALAVLLLRAEQVVSTDELIEALWGEVPPETARTALHGHVAALRKLLGAQAIATSQFGYRLRVRPEQIDLERFRMLVEQGRGETDRARRRQLLLEALALFRGEPLADFRYDTFARADRDRIEELRLGALELRLDTELELGLHIELVPELEDLVARHPLREGLRGQLMLALYRTGRQSDALRTYQEARRLLAQELGLDPGPALRELESQILSHDPSLALPRPATTTQTSQRHYERRVVTVLACDLIDATVGSHDRDPEDRLAVVESRHAVVRSHLQGFGGTIDNWIGESVVAIFGVPVAHEDDPERAVRAALVIRDKFAGGVEVHIAVHTGTALVNLEPDRGAGEPAVSGDVVDTAWRLHGECPANRVIVSEPTRRLSDHVVEYRRLQPVATPGGRAPVPVSEALMVRTVVGRRRPTVPLVGRRRELDQLTHALARARAERSPQLTTVVGVPGIGKTRLIEELYTWVEAASDEVAWLQGRALAYGESITLGALGEIVKTRAGIFEADTPEAAGTKLALAVEQTLGTAGEAAWVLRHLRSLVGLAVDDPPGDDTRDESFAAWRRFIEALAEAGPLVVVFEDLHWADETLLDFIDELVERVSEIPVLVVCTSRPELFDLRPGFGRATWNSTTIRLAPLPHEDTVALLEALLGERRASPQLVARADGNPLFAEEYARLVRELGDDSAHFVPESLQAVIAARLDILPAEEKTLIHDASVVGETAWVGATAAIGGRTRAEVEELTRRLERKEYLRRRRHTSIEGETEYAFSHILIRDVAYEQIPRAERGSRHQLAAEWIESLGRPEDHAELRANHYLRAVDFARATGHSIDELADRARRAAAAAGDRSASLGAYEVAGRYYEKALELWPDDPERPQLLLRHAKAVFLGGTDDAVSTTLENARAALLESGDVDGAAQTELLLGELVGYDPAKGPRVLDHLRRAAALVDARPTSRAKAETYIVNGVYLALFDQPSAPRYAEAGLAMAEELDAPDLRATALDRLAVVKMWQGEAEEALRRAEEGIALTEGVVSLAVVRATGNLASLLVDLGELTRSRRMNERCLTLASTIGARRDVRWATAERVLALYLDGEWDEASRSLEEYLQTARTAQYFTDGQCLSVRARIHHARGDLASARADTRSGLDIARQAEARQVLLPALALRARFGAGADRLEATALADEALAEIAGRRWIWAPACLIDLAYAARALHRCDQFTRATAAAYVTPWLEAARAIASGDFIAAAEIFAAIGSRPDEAYARLRGAEQLVAGGRFSQANDHAVRALDFWRSVEAGAYVQDGESVLSATD